MLPPAGGMPGFATLITNVTVIDGTGAPAFVSDVLVQGDMIGRIQPHIEQKGKDYTVVDGTGRVLIPGFLTPDCCCEAEVFGGEERTEAIRQGITTEILGQCGRRSRRCGSLRRKLPDDFSPRFTVSKKRKHRIPIQAFI